MDFVSQEDLNKIAVSQNSCVSIQVRFAWEELLAVCFKIIFLKPPKYLGKAPGMAPYMGKCPKGMVRNGKCFISSFTSTSFCIDPKQTCKNGVCCQATHMPYERPQDSDETIGSSDESSDISTSE
ncbi:hypothetical protein DdX_17782 [Ditylenchus destructor]|uniref:Uncharacterized protein n=1 Tax=Ditylenchus destructor TaxID=166010 RepID=A0AAD4QYP9_9BILA|nr:hypothetical protein DdX_17782 [Ditylenchus destructor]